MVSAIPEQEQFLGETDRLNLPPNSVQAEQALLGGLMLDKSAWDRVADRVNENDFYRPDHRLIFNAIRTLSERNEPCDAVTLSEYLDGHDELDNAGGLDASWSGIDYGLYIVTNSLLNFQWISHWHIVTGELKRRTHDRFFQRIQHRMYQRVLRHP